MHPTELAAMMVDVMTRVWRDAAALARIRVLPHVLCSVAAYVEDGRPVRQVRGAYTLLHTATGGADVADWFSAQVSARVRKAVRVSFAHDGTAAAAAYAGQKAPWRTAVVMLGTALGVGFVPEGGGYRPVAPDFTAEEAAVL